MAKKDKLVSGADTHFEFQDPKAVARFLKLVKVEDPGTVVIAGDILDEYTLSKFLRVPSNRGFTDEIQAGKKFLYDLREAAPDANIVVESGNHDQRAFKRIIEKLPEIHGLITFGGLLGCEELSILVLDDVEGVNYYEWHDVVVGHFNKAVKQAGRSSYALMEQYHKNFIQPHAHRGGLSFKRFWDHELWAMDLPCLCRLDPKFCVRPDWTQGAALVEWDGTKSIPHLIKF